MTKTEVEGLRKQLRWFIITSLSILAIVIQTSFSNAGFRKEIRAEIKALHEKVDLKNNSMQSLLDQTALIVSDMAIQGIQNGWYDPKINLSPKKDNK